MNEEERRETLREAKILEVLQHPNIIRFKEVYKTKKGKLCIVMDFADGGDLAQRIEALFKATGLPTRISLNTGQHKRLLEAMQLDKKVSQGQVKFVLAARLGKVSPGHSVETDAIHAALDSVHKN